MKIAVTSASGKLGTSILRELMREINKEAIVGVARTPEKVQDLGIEIRRGDYNKPEEFMEALKGIDTVLLLSGMDAPEKRIQQHRNVIEAAKFNGVRKIVYTSIIGDVHKTAFSSVVKSNRQTEQDIMNSGLNWTIGRNGIYIEPDVEYIENYKKEGEIRNCAGKGRCAYTSRTELSIAYTKMMLEDFHRHKIYNLVGEPITQTELAKYLNQVYHTSLSYTPVSIPAYGRP